MSARTPSSALEVVRRGHPATARARSATVASKRASEPRAVFLGSDNASAPVAQVTLFAKVAGRENQPLKQKRKRSDRFVPALHNPPLVLHSELAKGAILH